MPIYEFYCPDCHKIFRFLSQKVLAAGQAEKRPSCPACGRPNIERQVSLFAVSRSRPETSGSTSPLDEDVPDDIDERRLESAMEMLEREGSDLDEDDPRQAARVLRKFYDATGIRLGPAMEEAIHRMEGGEDPEAIEEELGEALEEEDPFSEETEEGQGEKKKRQPKVGGAGSSKSRAGRRRAAPPEVDENLYDL